MAQNILNTRPGDGPIPIESYPYKYGGTPTEDAAGRMMAMAEKQTNLNNTLIGGKKIKRKYKGGSGDVYEIPQFPQIGTEVSPQNANSSAVAINKAYINSVNNAAGDSLVGGKKYKRKIKRSKRSKKTRKSRSKSKRSRSRKSRKSISRKSRK